MNRIDDTHTIKNSMIYVASKTVGLEYCCSEWFVIQRSTYEVVLVLVWQRVNAVIELEIKRANNEKTTSNH